MTRKAANVARDEKNRKICERVEQWQNFTRTFAEEMSKDFGKTAEYYLHLLLSDMSSAKTARKPNAYNAWSSKILKDANQGIFSLYSIRILLDNPLDLPPGQARRLTDVQKEKKDEYNKLTDEQKQELIAMLEETRKTRKYGSRLSARAKLIDFISSTGKLEELVSEYHCCCVHADIFY